MKWVRWRWSDIGMGRWHVLVKAGKAAIPDMGVTIEFVVTACNRARPLPHEASPAPDGARCPECQSLVDLQARYQTEDRTAPVEPVLVTTQSDLIVEGDEG